MTDGTIGVTNNTATTAKDVDVAEATVGSNTVYRQRVVVADNTSNNYLAIDASGYLTVNVASLGGSLAVTQSGTWTVQPGNTANTTPWLFTISQGGNSATVSAGGALKVDNSAVTQPISGTVSGTGTAGTAATGVITVQGIASMTAIKVDGSAVTQPVSAASLPLPTGAATAAKQPALGTAGASSADVISVQGIASGTNLPISQATASSLNAQVVGSIAAGSADSGNPVKVGGKYVAAGVTLTDGNRGDLQLGLKGSLYVSVRGQDTTTTADIGNYNGDGNSAASFGGLQVISMGALYNGSTLDRPRSIVNATNSTGTGIVAAGLVAQLDDTAPTSITENQFGNVRMNSARALNTSAKPDTLGGVTTGRVVTGTTGVIKNAAGQVYGLNAYNVNAALRWLHIYNKTTAPTLSTDTPLWSIALPPTSQTIIPVNDIGVAFSTGISWAYTTDNVAIPTTAGTSAEMLLTVLYN